MTKADFTVMFRVPQSPEAVFAAINDVRSWWAGEIDGPTNALGAEFTYRHGEAHRSTQRVTTFVPGRKVAWRVVDSRLAFADTPDEWTGTDIVFDIARSGGETEVRFSHIGLVPRVQCYEACSQAWTFFAGKSLRSLITTGAGLPSPYA